MRENLKNLLQKAKYENNSNLAENVWNKLIIRNKKIARIKLTIYTSIELISVTGLIKATQKLLTDLSGSGFYEYLSILFSNGTSIFSYWKELTYSLLESLPASGITMSLGLVFIMIIGFKFIINQIIKGQIYQNKYLTLTI